MSYTYYAYHTCYIHIKHIIQMCFIYIGNVPMAAGRWNLARNIAYHRANLERFLFLIWCTPRAI